MDTKTQKALKVGAIVLAALSVVRGIQAALREAREHATYTAKHKKGVRR